MKAAVPFGGVLRLLVSKIILPPSVSDANRPSRSSNKLHFAGTSHLYLYSKPSSYSHSHFFLSQTFPMENLISLVNKIQRACTALGDHGETTALPTLWDSLPAIAVVGGQVSSSLFIYLFCWSQFYIHLPVFNVSNSTVSTSAYHRNFLFAKSTYTVRCGWALGESSRVLLDHQPFDCSLGEKI